MLSPTLYHFFGLSCCVAVAASMFSDSYEASFGLLPRTLTNLQSFTEALGGASASAITNSGDPARPFMVRDSTFPDFKSAGTRSCANQFNDCQDLANNGTFGGGATFTVTDCSGQQTRCDGTQATASAQNFRVLVSSDANFDYVCDS